MEQRKGVYEWAGQPADLTGPELKDGNQAPAFDLIDSDGGPLPSSAAEGKVLIIATMPSVDTPVCDKEAHRLFEEAPNLLNVAMLAVTMDLPFAQKRWATAAAVNEKVKLASDHQRGDFGAAYGVLDGAHRLLARAVFVIDATGTVRHVEYCKAAGDMPDLDKAFATAKALTQAV